MLVCDVCGQALSSEAAVRQHLRRPHLGRPPRCPLCGAAGCEELCRHIGAAQAEPGPPGTHRPQLTEGLPVCPVCGEAAGRELEAHVRARHGQLLGGPGGGERPRQGRGEERASRPGPGGGWGWPSSPRAGSFAGVAGTDRPGGGCSVSGARPECLVRGVFSAGGAAGELWDRSWVRTGAEGEGRR